MGNRSDNFYTEGPNKGKPISSAEVIQRVRQETDTVLMAFSRGKDSIAAWLAIQDKFPTIVPYHMYLVPDLSFVEENLQYFEKVFGCHILRVPHNSIYRQLKNLTFQPPERCAVIERAAIEEFTHEDLRDLIIWTKHLPKETFTAVGVRAADSPQRRMAVNNFGPINWKNQAFWPVWDMYKDGLIDLLKRHNIKLPVDYDLFNRSFDGLDYRFLKPLKDQRPDDYRKILEWFPLADLEIFRYERCVGGTRAKG